MTRKTPRADRPSDTVLRAVVRNWHDQARTTIALIRAKPHLFDTPAQREFIRSCRYFARGPLRELAERNRARAGAFWQIAPGVHTNAAPGRYRDMGGGRFARVGA